MGGFPTHPGGSDSGCRVGGSPLLLDTASPSEMPVPDVASSWPCLPSPAPRTNFSKCKPDQLPPLSSTQGASLGPGDSRDEGQSPVQVHQPHGPPIWSRPLLFVVGHLCTVVPNYMSQSRTPAPPGPPQCPSAEPPLGNSLCPRPALSDTVVTS